MTRVQHDSDTTIEIEDPRHRSKQYHSPYGQFRAHWFSQAAGFLGSNLVDFLLAEGHEVIGVDGFQTGSPKHLKHLEQHEQFTFVKYLYALLWRAWLIGL